MGTEMTQVERVTEATARGTERGENARHEIVNPQGFEDYTPEWLSGEWAGESIAELLGDLLTDDMDENDEIMDAYCDAADSAFYSVEA